MVPVSAFEVLFHLAAEFFGSGEGFEARGRIKLLVELVYLTEAAVALGEERAQRRPAVWQHLTGGAAGGPTQAGAQSPAKRTTGSRVGQARGEEATVH